MRTIFNRKFKRQALVIANISLIAVIAFVMIFAHLFVSGGAVVSPNAHPRISDVTGQFRSDMSEFLDPRFLIDEDGFRPMPTDDVTVILGLSGRPAHERFREDSLRFSDDFSTYLDSPQGRNAVRAILNEQDRLIRSISNAGINHTVEFRYNITTNAVAVTVQYRDLARLERLPGITSSVVSRTYEPMSASARPTDPVFGGLWQYADNQTGVRVDRDTGLLYSGIHGMDGRGVVVAVIDSGFDFGHEIFSTMPEGDIRFTREEVARIFPRTHAYSAGARVSDVFINERIPFQFCYGENVANVQLLDMEHGTHVAGIVGGRTPGFEGHSIVELEEGYYTITREEPPYRPMIRGAAYNAQLVLMKITSIVQSEHPIMRSETILAAIEDAVTLGVDIINLSLGRHMGFSRAENEYEYKIYGGAREAGIHVVAGSSNSWTSARSSPWGDTGLTHNPDTNTLFSPSSFRNTVSVGSMDRLPTPYMIADGNLLVYFDHLENFDQERVYFLERVDAEWRRQNGAGPNDPVPNVFPYYVALGQGLPHEFVNARGRIAVVARGGLTFEAKRTNAMNAGALGLIIYNNVPGRFMVPVDHNRDFATTSAPLDIGLELMSRREGYMRVRGDNGEPQFRGPFIATSSSWGPSPDLRMKPNIIGFGDNILSGVYGGRYQEMGGTSMSGPNVAGALAVVRQHVNQESQPGGLFHSVLNDSQRPMEILQLVQNLMSSTATIMYTRYNIPYFTRVQGAGMIDIHNAIRTRSFISVPHETEANGFTDFAQLELFDCVDENGNWTGVWDLSFNIHNLSGINNLEYTLSLDASTETACALNRFVLERPRNLGGATLTINSVIGGTQHGNNVVRVNSGDVATVNATIRITQAELEMIRNSFRYGMFVEGFLRIAVGDSSQNQLDLSVPFLAYAGDWTAGPLFDIDVFRYHTDLFNTTMLPEHRIRPDKIVTTPIGASMSLGQVPMGQYLWADPASPMGHPASRERVAMSYGGIWGGSGGISSLDFVNGGLLRAAGAMSLTVIETDTGREVFTRELAPARKAGFTFTQGAIVGGRIGACGTDWSLDLIDFGRDGLRNNVRYEAIFTGHIDFPNRPREQHTTNNNVWTLPIFADTEEPVLKNAVVSEEWDHGINRVRTFLNLTAFDNHFLKSVTPQVLEPETRGVPYRFLQNIRHPHRIDGGLGEVVTTRLEITDLMHTLEHHPVREERGMLYLTIHDYALNESTFVVNVGQMVRDYRENRTTTLPGQDMIALNFNAFRFDQAHFSDPGNAFPTDPSGRLHHIGFGGTGIGLFGGESITVFHNVRGPHDFSEFELRLPANLPANITNNFDVYIGEDGFLRIHAIRDNATLNDVNFSLAMAVYRGTQRFPTTLHFTHRSSFVMHGWTLQAFRGLGEAIYAEDGVTEIGRRVVIPDDRRVATIGAFAFSGYEWGRIFNTAFGRYMFRVVNGGLVRDYRGDSHVTEVVIPGTVQTIGRYAFAGLPYLERVIQVPDRFGNRQLAGIMHGAFMNTPNLRNVDIRGVSMVDAYAFYNSPNFNPDSLESITYMGNYAFARNNTITSVNLTNLRSSGFGIFAHSTALTHAIVGEWTYFGPGMFFENTNLQDLEISARSIADGLGTNNLGNIHTSSGAFARMPNLRTVNFTRPEGLALDQPFYVDIGAGAFLGAHNLHTVTFSEGVRVARLGREAFSGTNIRHIHLLEESIVTIEESAFPSTLDTLTLGVRTRLDLQPGALRNTHNMSRVILAPNHEFYTLQADNLTILEGTAMGFRTLVAAFGNRTAITRAQLINVDIIGRGAFAGSNIVDVDLRPGIEVREFAFAGAQFLTNIIAQNIRLEGNEIFRDTTSLMSINLQGVNRIPMRTFIGSAVRNVTLGGTAGTLNIEYEAFARLDNLNRVTILNGPTRVNIADYAFFDNMELRSIALPASADPASVAGQGVFIGYRAFFHNLRLEEIINDHTVREVGEFAFASVMRLETINMPQLTHIPEGAFEGELLRFYWDVLGGFGFPFAIYDDLGFHLHSHLRFVNIPQVEVIGERAFANTPLLREIITGPNLRVIEEEAFAVGPLDWWMYNHHDLMFPGRWSRLEPFHFRGRNTQLSINLGNVETIGDRAFFQRGVLNADLRSLVNFGEEAFAYSDVMQTIQFNPNMTHIPYRAFYSAGLSGATFNWPNITHIGHNAFANSNIRHVEFENIVHIGHNAFRNNENLTIGAVPRLEFIGNFAFFGSNIETFEVPRTLNFFGYGVFAATPLREISIQNNHNPIFELINGVFLVETVLINGVPNGHRILLAFPNADETLVQNGRLEVPYGVTIAGDKIFYGNENIVHIVFPHSLSIVGDRALFGATNLEVVEFTSQRAPTLWASFDQDFANEYVINNLYRQGELVDILSWMDRFESNWNHSVLPSFYANFVGRIAEMSTRPLVMIRPENGIGFDNFIFNAFFNTQLSSEVLTIGNHALIQQIRDFYSRPVIIADNFLAIQTIRNAINSLQIFAPTQHRIMTNFEGVNYVQKINTLFSGMNAIIVEELNRMFTILPTNVTRENFRAIQEEVARINVLNSWATDSLSPTNRATLDAVTADVTYFVQVYNVIDLIRALPPVINQTLHMLEVSQIMEAYDNLTASQRALISAEDRNTLYNAYYITTGVQRGGCKSMSVATYSAIGAVVLVLAGAMLLLVIAKRKKQKQQ